LLNNHIIQKARDTTVHIVSANNVVSGGEQFETGVNSGHAAGEAYSVLAILNGSKIVLEYLAGRV
jgi:hypothetical protein